MTTSRKRRSRRLPAQGELALKLDKNGQRRGGARARAGRKPVGTRAGSPHKPRPELNPRHPVHVTLRVLAEVGWLRRRDAFHAVRRALARIAANHHAFRIVHISIQGTHLHVLCEAADKSALARGLQGFQVSAAKALNAAVTKRTGVRRRGTVFSDRYHAEPISSVRQARHALSYVLNNWRRHAQDRGRVGLFGGRVDPFSSGVVFAGWRDALATWGWPADDELLPVCRAQTWLLAESWKRASPIGAFEVPGSRTDARRGGASHPSYRTLESANRGCPVAL